jgi:hypothetical protein
MLLVRWPVGLSFGDEVGYVGQMRLILEGRLHPSAGDPGVWVQTLHGEVAKFPYLVPLLEAPLFAIAPRLVFVPSVLAAVALSFLAARILRSWGRDSAWGLVVLAYPPVVLIARTAMTDLILATTIVGAWWAMRRERPAMASTLLGATIAVKAVGFVLVAALLTGEAARTLARFRRGERPTLRPFLHFACGALAGFAVSVSLNLAANGTPWSVYDQAHSYLHTPSFWPQYLRTSAPAHIASLLLAPPLLIAGVWPLWQRREYGPLVLIATLVSMMCFYFFVDRGRSFLETLFMSPRLILPAAAFLLIGYADLLARLGDRFPPDPWRALAILTPAALCLTISTIHRRWQAPGATALSAVSRLAETAPSADVGLTWSAVKTAIFYRGSITVLDEQRRPQIVLCSTHYASYRDPNEQFSCSFPGYKDRMNVAEFHLLTRENSAIDREKR